MRESKSIIITCIGGGLSYEFIELLKSSKRYEYSIVGVDTSESAVARHICDAFEKVPNGADSSYAEHMHQICKKHGIDLIFPCSDAEALALARYRKAFDDEGIVVACNDYETLLTISDKAKTYRKLEDMGFGTPLWCQTFSHKKIREQISELTSRKKSAVVKLPDARGSRGIFVLDDKVEGETFYNNTREIHANPTFFLNDILPTLNPEDGYIVMERLLEPVCDLDVLAWHGEVVHSVSRRRLDSASPNNGHVVEQNVEVMKLAKNIVQKMDLSWIFDVDYMFASDGSPVILEINPRASGSVAVPIAAGVPLFDDMLSLVFGENIEEIKYPEQMVVYPVKSLRKRSLR